MSKFRILEQAGIETTGIDAAYPQQWANKVRELGIEPGYYCFDHRDNAFGQPIHPLEELDKSLYKAGKESIVDYIRYLEFVVKQQNRKLSEEDKFQHPFEDDNLM